MRPRVDGLIAFTNVAGNGINWMATVIDRSARPTTTGRRVGTTPHRPIPITPIVVAATKSGSTPTDTRRRMRALPVQ